MLRIGFLGEAFGGNSAIRALRSEITAQLSQTADVISYAAGDKHIRCDYLIIESSDVFIDHINQLFGEFRAVPPELLGARFIVQFKHDLYSHRGESFKIYCDLLDSYTHYFIHFSKYSQHMFLEKFPQAVHVCVHHPGYQIPAAPASREVLRSNLNISAGTLVFLFFGTSRKYTESEWILDFFRHSGGKRKFLLLSNNILAGNLIQRNLLRFRLIQTSHKMGNSKVKDEDIAALCKRQTLALCPDSVKVRSIQDYRSCTLISDYLLYSPKILFCTILFIRLATSAKKILTRSIWIYTGLRQKKTGRRYLLLTLIPE